MKKGMNGTMIRKLKDSWLSIILAIVVIFSIVLSFFIWVAPYNNATHNRGDAGNVKQFNLQSIGDIYLPTEVVRVKSDGSAEMLYGQRDNLVLTSRNIINKWHFGNPTRVSHDDQQHYLDMLRMPKTMVLSYYYPVPTAVFNQVYSQDLNTKRMGRVTRIVLPLNNRNTAYLLNDSNFAVYRVHLSKNQNQKLNSLLASTGGGQVNVDRRVIDHRIYSFYMRGITLPSFAYQVETQKIDNVTHNLMNDTNGNNISTSNKGNITVYQNGTNKRLTYNHETKTISYDNYLGKNNNLSTTQLYNTLYQRLTKTGVVMDSMRFDQFNEKQQAITYVPYVEGFPVYSPDGYGTVKISENYEGVERYRYSLYSLQTPVPTNAEKVKLPSTAAVVNELRQSGKYKEISGIRVGYNWDSQSTDEKTVTLKPTYFVDYHGTWINYQELLK